VPAGELSGTSSALAPTKKAGLTLTQREAKKGAPHQARIFYFFFFFFLISIFS